MQSLRLENWGLEERSWPELVEHGACTGERLQGWQGGTQVGWMLKLQTTPGTARTRATCTLLFKNSASCTTGQTIHRVKIQKTEQRHVMAGGTTNQKDVPFMLGTRDAQCCLFLELEQAATLSLCTVSRCHLVAMCTQFKRVSCKWQRRLLSSYFFCLIERPKSLRIFRTAAF